MYANYFGLKEPSFSITPDPQYLFLSDQHREALAHLVYGAGENGGFVLLTGEVGTGKTTVCRAFLEQLPKHVDLALILHPALSATELLRTICDEFRIPLLEEDRTAKRLVDRLNRYLLEAHAQGRRPVLMIDESQDLSPRVLEQIRLLTNLEMPKHKLLQSFLVGQPELREMLHNPGLRQSISALPPVIISIPSVPRIRRPTYSTGSPWRGWIGPFLLPWCWSVAPPVQGRPTLTISSAIRPAGGCSPAPHGDPAHPGQGHRGGPGRPLLA